MYKNDPNVLANLAGVAAETGDHERARVLGRRSLEAARKINDVRVEVEALVVLEDLDAAVELANRIDYPVGRHKAQLKLAKHDPALARELLRDVQDGGDLLLESQALLVLAEATRTWQRRRWSWLDRANRARWWRGRRRS